MTIKPLGLPVTPRISYEVQDALDRVHGNQDLLTRLQPSVVFNRSTFQLAHRLLDSMMSNVEVAKNGARDAPYAAYLGRELGPVTALVEQGKALPTPGLISLHPAAATEPLHAVAREMSEPLLELYGLAEGLVAVKSISAG